MFDVGILHAGLKGASVELRRGELLGLELALGLEHLVLGPVEHRVDVVLRLRAQRELLLFGAQRLTSPQGVAKEFWQPLNHIC